MMRITINNDGMDLALVEEVLHKHKRIGGSWFPGSRGYLCLVTIRSCTMSLAYQSSSTDGIILP